MEESPSVYETREIKLVKKKDSYGTYLVRKKLLSDADKELLIVVGILFFMWIIF